MFFKNCNEFITDVLLFSVIKVKGSFSAFIKKVAVALVVINTVLLFNLPLGLALSAVMLNAILYVWYIRRLGYILYVQDHTFIEYEAVEITTLHGPMKLTASFAP